MTLGIPVGDNGQVNRHDDYEPTWGPDGLLPVIVQEVDSRQVLMLAWMNSEALRRTRVSGDATYWSRSRQEYWVKGATSGHRQRVVEVRLDCDADALLLLVHQTGPACHTNSTSCFDDRLLELSPDGVGA